MGHRLVCFKVDTKRREIRLLAAWKLPSELCVLTHVSGEVFACKFERHCDMLHLVSLCTSQRNGDCIRLASLGSITMTGNGDPSVDCSAATTDIDGTLISVSTATGAQICSLTGWSAALLPLVAYREASTLPATARTWQPLSAAELRRGTAWLCAVAEREKPWLGLQKFDNLVSKVSELWLSLLEKEFHHTLSNVCDEDVYEIIHQCSPSARDRESTEHLHAREVLKALQNVFCLFSAVVELLQHCQFTHLISQCLLRLTNRGLLMESLLVRCLESYLIRGKENAALIEALPITFGESLLRLYSKRLEGAMCRTCDLESRSIEITGRHLCSTTKQQCIRCTFRLTHVLSTLIQHNVETRQNMLAQSTLLSFHNSPAMGFAACVAMLQDCFWNTVDSARTAFDFLIYQASKYRHWLINSFVNGARPLSTKDLEECISFPVVNLYVWNTIKNVTEDHTARSWPYEDGAVSGLSNHAVPGAVLFLFGSLFKAISTGIWISKIGHSYVDRVGRYRTCSRSRYTASAGQKQREEQSYPACVALSLSPDGI